MPWTLSPSNPISRNSYIEEYTLKRCLFTHHMPKELVKSTMAAWVITVGTRNSLNAYRKETEPTHFFFFLNQHIFISSNNGVPCSDEKIIYTSYKSPQGSQGILLQDISKSLKIHIISVYLCQVQNMQREAAFDWGYRCRRYHPEGA